MAGGLNPNLSLHLVESMDDVYAFMEWLRRPRAIMGVDTETGGFDWWRLPLRTVQLGDGDMGWTFEFDRWKGVIQEALRIYGGDIVMHNAKFDLHFLKENGIHIPQHRVHDSLLLAGILAPHMPVGLKPVAERLVDRRAISMQSDLKDGMIKHKWGWDTVPIEFPPYWRYAALDPVLTVRIWEELTSNPLYQSFRQVYDVDLGVSFTILDMERRGIALDVGYCGQQMHDLTIYLNQFEDWALAEYGLKNPNSDKQIIQVLKDQGCRFTKFTDKGNVSTNAEVLEELGHPLATALVQYRHADKMRSTYFSSWLDFVHDGRLHPTFNISGARTGRMSSERPNLQNVPRSRKLRWPLVPKEGHKLILADYDQIELRLMAHYAEEAAMIDAIHAGEDLHSYTAKLVYQVDEPSKEQRRVAKSSNFAKIYGAGIGKFAETAGIDVTEAQMFLDGYDREFPGVRTFQGKITQQAHSSAATSEDKLAHVISDYIGRQQVVDPNQAYKLVNYLIQGTAADVLKVKMLDLDAAGLGDYMVVPIHDELAFEVPEDDVEDFVQKLPGVMEDHSSFKVPLSAGIEIVDRWGEKYEEGT